MVDGDGALCRGEGTRGRWKSCGVLLRSIRCWPNYATSILRGLLGGVRMIRAGVDLELAVHRVSHLRLRQHAADGFLDETDRLALADDRGALLAQPALVSAVPAIELLVFLASGQLHLGRVDDDDVVPGVDERGVDRLVLALEQLRRQASPLARAPVRWRR